MIIYLDESGDLGFDFNRRKTSRNKEEIRDFNGYMANQLEALLPLNIPLNIYHEHSHENAGLQAADLFCWGVFRKYEAGDSVWYDVYRSAIRFETEYLA